MDMPLDDFGKTAADIAAKIIGDNFDKVTGGISEGIRKARLKFYAGFQDYINVSLSRTTRVKTILNPDSPSALEDIYVPLEFTFQGSREKTEADVTIAFKKRRHVLILGTAGSGKSMFLRKLNISLIREYKTILPIYFELRRLNANKDRPMIEVIFESVKAHISAMVLDEFVGAVRHGRFALLLDGFDEIDHDTRQGALKRLIVSARITPALQL